MRNILFFCFCLSLMALNGQNEFKVRRGFKIDRSAPIYNIHVDDKGLKWVSDELGLVLIQSANFAEPLPAKEAIWSLLSVPEGNYELNIPIAELKKYVDPSIISCAQYDRGMQELWIGTRNQGLYRLKIGGTIREIDHLTYKNSKLRSNTIQTILITSPSRLWVGTDDGLLEINGERTRLAGKNFSIEDVAVNNGAVWVVSDGEVLELDKDKWDFFYFDVKRFMTEGLVKDIAFDSRERIWIASEVVTRYDFDKESYEVYGPIQEFTSQNVNCIAVDFDDAVWVGTEDKGLYFIGKTSTLIAEVVISTPLDCTPNAKNAALQVRASGGEPPYTYKWNTPGLRGESPKDISAGSYKVTITDQDKNTTEAEIEIADHQFTVNVQQERPASLGGSADGQAKLTIEPDSRNFSIQWDNGENTRLAQKLTVGEHSVTITGEKGCTTVSTVEIGEALAPLSVNLEETKSIDCAGDASATLKANAKGGQAPYSYTWSPATGNGQQLEQLKAGTYAITVQDAEGSQANASITVNQPDALVVTVSQTGAASANNADGKAKVKAKGGQGKYSYKWDTGETTETASKLPSGKHSVTVTDVKGCSSISSVEINENIQSLSVDLEETSPVKCAGDNTAALAATISGGKAPFTYTWSTDKGNGEKASDLPAGTYKLTVGDAAGNNASADITIKQPEALSATASARAPASTNNADGKAKVTAKGGNGKYTYKWDTGETTATAEKLKAGSHSVTITDAAGCTTNTTVSITENILELAVALEEEAKIKCAGGNSAVLKVSASGGKPPFQYQWSTDKGSGEKASGLEKGKYTVSVTDAAGTTKTAEWSVAEPAPLQVKVQQTVPASANNSDGEAVAKVTGGTGNYAYKWDTGVTAATATGLSPGNHSVSVTDQNGCTNNTSIAITENILPLSVSIKQTAEIKCFGEETAALEVEVQGGKSPFQYTWSSSSITGKTAKQLAAGTYVLTLTDASGSAEEASFIVKEPEALQVVMEKPGRATNADSKDGKASIKVTGGTPDYTAVWTNSETGLTASKLPIGNHSVTVADAKGCTNTQSVEIKKKNLPALTAGSISAGQTLQVSQIFFDIDSTIMKPTSYPVVDEIADFLEENPLVVIEVGGHTNSLPPHEYCDKLSTGRAKSVAEYIVQKGVDPTRVIYKGYGKRKPRFSNKTKDGRQRNQRVEIKILRLN